MSSPDPRPLLSTTRAAELLGVHPSSVKRWCDAGSLSAAKTGGGHRRIPLSEVLRWARREGISSFLDPFHPWEANVWLALSEAEDGNRFQRLENLALTWLAQGESDLLGRLLYETARRPGVTLSIFLDRFLRSFMSRVGEEWQKGRLQVGEEHMASQVVQEVLFRLRPGWDRLSRAVHSLGTPAQDPPPVAVVGAVEGNEHSLGAMAIRLVLEHYGWRVYFLGPNVPLEDFATIQRAQAASLVCISFSPPKSTPDVVRAARVLGELYRPSSPYTLALGGSVGNLDLSNLPPGPFEELFLAASAEALAGWLERRGAPSQPATPFPHPFRSKRIA